MPAKTPVTLEMVYDLVQTIQTNYESFYREYQTSTKYLIKTTNRIDASLLVIKSRLSELEQRVAAICERLEAVTRSVDGLVQELSKLNDEYHAISVQLKRLETRFDHLEADQLSRRVSALGQKIIEIEKSKQN